MKQNWIKVGLYIALVLVMSIHRSDEEHSHNEAFYRIEFQDYNQYIYTGNTESVVLRYKDTLL